MVGFAGLIPGWYLAKRRDRGLLYAALRGRKIQTIGTCLPDDPPSVGSFFFSFRLTPAHRKAQDQKSGTFCDSAIARRVNL